MQLDERDDTLKKKKKKGIRSRVWDQIERN